MHRPLTTLFFLLCLANLIHADSRPIHLKSQFNYYYYYLSFMYRGYKESFSMFMIFIYTLDFLKILSKFLCYICKIKYIYSRNMIFVCPEIFFF